MSKTRLDINFSCAHEISPVPPVKADVLFKYARWLQKNNQLKRLSDLDGEIEVLYRIASESGHHKANINLQNGAIRGQFRLSGREHLRLSQELIKQDIATGFYFIAIFLEQGSAGLKADKDMALGFYKKAADRGNAQAQFYVGDLLEPKDVAPHVASEMYRCAAEQGMGKAALALGIHFKGAGEYKKAIAAFQLGIAAGDDAAALALERSFGGPLASDKIYYLGLERDIERAARYKVIRKMLSGYSYAQPTIPEIDEILPLPPAELPSWSGKFHWLEERLANVPPEKPSEALIKQLADAKGLDPSTGKPKPGSPIFDATNFPVMTCHTGDPCPETGYWKMLMNSWTEDVRYFNEGEIMPSFEMTMTESRLWPFSDKVSLISEPIGWGLLG